MHAFLKEAVARARLKSRVRVSQAGCLDQCGHGPMVVIYPDDVWYSHVSLEEAQAIFSEHILAGRPVDALRFRVGEPGRTSWPGTRTGDRPSGVPSVATGGPSPPPTRVSSDHATDCRIRRSALEPHGD